MTSLSFFQFMANLQPSGIWIPDACFLKLTFSLIVTFHLTKPENRTKKSLTQLSYYCFEERYYFCQKILFFCKKNTDISKIKSILVLKGIFSETKHTRVLTKFQAYSVILTSFRRGLKPKWATTNPQPQNEHLKSSP